MPNGAWVKHVHLAGLIIPRCAAENNDALITDSQRCKFTISIKYSNSILAVNTITFQRIGPYLIAVAEPLPTSVLRQFAAVFDAPARRADHPLGGRQAVSRLQASATGPLVVKAYHRGGLIQHINQHHYVRWGKPRCQDEFEMLAIARRRGVLAPEPIAWATRGHHLYRCWLILRAIDNQGTLAQVARKDAPRALAALPAVTDQVRRLMDHNILHVDLHPGNVLITPNGRPYLIDFDRARYFRGSQQDLRGRYIRRWRRAVEKHHLPDSLAIGLERMLKANPRTS